LNVERETLTVLNKDLEPRGEGLRNAVRWLSEHAPVTRDAINEAAQRFNLSPLEEEFLLKEYRHQSGESTT
jgi:hypothetical protein